MISEEDLREALEMIERLAKVASPVMARIARDYHSQAIAVGFSPEQAWELAKIGLEQTKISQ